MHNPFCDLSGGLTASGRAPAGTQGGNAEGAGDAGGDTAPRLGSPAPCGRSPAAGRAGTTIPEAQICTLPTLCCTVTPRGGVRERERSLQVIRGPQSGPAGPLHLGSAPQSSTAMQSLCTLLWGDSLLGTCPAGAHARERGERVCPVQQVPWPLVLLPCPCPPFLGGGREVLRGQEPLSPPIPP